jgi:hypothetical protein
MAAAAKTLMAQRILAAVVAVVAAELLAVRVWSFSDT